LVNAMIAAASTITTISACIQSQKGGMARPG
jgi:hypothetical protein